MSTRPKMDDDARHELEDTLTQIYGLSKVLMELGIYDDVASYLGGRLHDHYDTAQDAFCRIYGLSRYSKDGKVVEPDDAEKGGAA